MNHQKYLNEMKYFFLHMYEPKQKTIQNSWGITVKWSFSKWLTIHYWVFSQLTPRKNHQLIGDTFSFILGIFHLYSRILGFGGYYTVVKHGPNIFFRYICCFPICFMWRKPPRLWLIRFKAFNLITSRGLGRLEWATSSSCVSVCIWTCISKCNT